MSATPERNEHKTHPETLEQLLQSTPEMVGFQSYEYFRSDAHARRADFIASSETQLSLGYVENDPESLDRLAQVTTEALIYLNTLPQTKQGAALHGSLEYRLAEMSLVSASIIMNDQDAPEDRRHDAKAWFTEMNEALYGHPEKAVFSGLAHEFVTPLLIDDEMVTPEIQSIRDELKAMIGDIDTPDYSPYEPDKETIQLIHDLVHERFASLVEHVDPEKIYEKDAIVLAMEEALDIIDAREKGWFAELTPDSTALAVSAHRRVVEVGEHRKAISGDDLRAKIMHEVGVHVLRSVEAERAGWTSAAYGQEGYLPFEEALATALEDAYKGEFKHHGINYYLIAGFALGQDNQPPRNFRDTYEIMWRINTLQKASGSGVDEDQIKRAKARAYTSCMRIFRGTTTRDPGVIYTKDLAYFNGQERAWSVLDAVTDQSDMDILFSGKLDLSQQEHREIAEDILRRNDSNGNQG